MSENDTSFVWATGRGVNSMGKISMRGFASILQPEKPSLHLFGP